MLKLGKKNSDATGNIVIIINPSQFLENKKGTPGKPGVPFF